MGCGLSHTTLVMWEHFPIKRSPTAVDPPPHSILMLDDQNTISSSPGCRVKEPGAYAFFVARSALTDGHLVLAPVLAKTIPDPPTIKAVAPLRSTFLKLKRTSSDLVLRSLSLRSSHLSAMTTSTRMRHKTTGGSTIRRLRRRIPTCKFFFLLK